MIKEEAIIQSVLISGAGEQKYFQIALPEDTEKIIGIETGIIKIPLGGRRAVMRFIYVPPGFLTDPNFLIRANEVIGHLSLQGFCRTGIFYQDEIRENDKNYSYADWAFPYQSFNEFSHLTKRYEVDVEVNTDTPLIEAFYRDTWGAALNAEVSYQLNICIWIQKKIK